ncbi:N-acetylglucosamine-6-phosphate deacetylase [Roseimaritima multifibrata]|uniref:N-acetylglucosamine-6-phosphate deacetylase n=1 Tax=Roseimaritima multifibrata TaxID=1930274 RepID=A0A517M9B9_9BACT|nr:amidohydrolase family protein [Roseimaritima multifibrata]QDS91488.1 N-acetylglucosamine-6-phosphate deacetylase [Roseimaritima multifibrata]
MTNPIAFVNASAVLPDQVLRDAVVICQEGKIVSVSERGSIPADAAIVDLAGRYLTPGFIDIHVHGGSGADFMDGDPRSIRQAAAAHLTRGTTTLFPTTTTGAPAEIQKMLSACQQVADVSTAKPAELEVPHIPGIHLYGPYFADDKVGCHDKGGRRDPAVEEFQHYFETGFVRVATCAAELPGAKAFYQMAAAHDCLVTCGHSNSSWSEMQSAFDAGMRHVDHFWCAMSSVPSLRTRFQVPMQASMTEFVLMNKAMSTEVIADGWHLSPELLEFAYQMKGPERLCLVTDANRALGMPAGEYIFGNQDSGSPIYSDGNVGWSSDRTSLASSIVGMDHMVRHFKNSTTAPVEHVIRMATLTPAERVGIDHEVGSVQAGKRADLLVLDTEFNIQQVYKQGRLVIDSDSTE